MKEVEVSRCFDISADKVHDLLNPISILEFEGTFKVESVDPTSKGQIVEVSTKETQHDSVMVLEFTETNCGYRYEQIDKGLFDHLVTEIAIKENDRTEVTHRSKFEFGGMFRLVKSWLLSDLVGREGDRFLGRLEEKLVEDYGLERSEDD